jgi:isopenicillin N synthase-like dioxygenase
LQVQNVEGKYIPVTPVKGAVIVNIADLMQRWTSDRLKSTVSETVNKLYKSVVNKIVQI